MYFPTLRTSVDSSLLLPDLTPNVGLWWYFFIEIFDSFRSFFLVVFQLHLLIYVAPLCIRLHRHPLSIITTLIGIISIFKSYPSVSDLAIYLALLSLHTEIFSRTSPPSLELTFRYEIRVPCLFNAFILGIIRARIPSSMDLCREWKRKFLLRNYSRIQSRPNYISRRRVIRNGES